MTGHATAPSAADTTVTPVVPATSRRWLTAGDGIDGLEVRDVETPRVGPGQVLIRVEAVSLNYRDLLVVKGEEGWRPPEPVTPISDAAGTIEAVGAGVTRFAVGDRVSPMFLPHWRAGALSAETYRSPIGGPIASGVLADFLVLDQDHVEAVPSSLGAAEAAALPIAALTAWHAVAVRCRVGRGDRVLVHGTGGVAMFALRFATALGARVAVTTSSSTKAVRLAGLGADHVVDYRSADVADEVLRWTGGRGVDHVVETVGGANLNQSLRAVRIGGSIAFIGLLAGLSAPINTYELVTKNVELHGIETGSAEMYRDMARFIDAHSIKPVIDSVAPLADVRDALRRLEKGDHFGKIVLVGEGVQSATTVTVRSSTS
jgi:NADPH:quinone reductase-like Zn-dependent oxidoreductase